MAMRQIIFPFGGHCEKFPGPFVGKHVLVLFYVTHLINSTRVEDRAFLKYLRMPARVVGFIGIAGKTTVS